MGTLRVIKPIPFSSYTTRVMHARHLMKSPLLPCSPSPILKRDTIRQHSLSPNKTSQ
jgi:hypothetical protein